MCGKVYTYIYTHTHIYNTPLATNTPLFVMGQDLYCTCGTSPPLCTKLKAHLSLHSPTTLWCCKWSRLRRWRSGGWMPFPDMAFLIALAKPCSSNQASMSLAFLFFLIAFFTITCFPCWFSSRCPQFCAAASMAAIASKAGGKVKQRRKLSGDRQCWSQNSCSGCAWESVV